MADGLSGDVKVPIAGNVPKKELAIGGAAVGLLIVVYYVRKRQTASTATTAASSASTTDQYPPDGTVGNPQDPYSTDPATNQTYGDEAAGSGGTFGAFGPGLNTGISSDSYPWDGTYGDPSDPFSMDPATQQTYGDEGLSGNTGTGTSGPPFSNNEAWSAYVLQQEQSLNPSADIGSWTDALGLYLNGQPVDKSQQQIIFDAIAIGGDPPVAGSNSYPPNVRLNGDKGGQTSVTVPDVVGDRADVARQALRAAGLAYNIADNAEGSVTAQTPKAGSAANSGSTVKLTLKTGASGGQAASTVPDVTGLGVGQARSALTAAGYKDHETGHGSYITGQNPKAGTRLAANGTVTLTLGAKK